MAARTSADVRANNSIKDEVGYQPAATKASKAQSACFAVI